MMILAFLIIGPILLLCLCAYGWREKYQTVLGWYEAARAEIARLRELNAAISAVNELQKESAETLRQIAIGANERAKEMTALAREAIRERAKETGLDPDEVLPGSSLPIFASRPSGKIIYYAPPIVAFCPACNVSVRHNPDEYPIPCPACQTLIDPVFDNPPEL